VLLLSETLVFTPIGTNFVLFLCTNPRGCKELRELNTNLLVSIIYIIRVIKSRRIRWTGHVARMEQIRSAYIILVVKPEGREHMEDQEIDGILC